MHTHHMSSAIFVFDTSFYRHTQSASHIQRQKIENNQAATEKLRKLIKRCQRRVCAKANKPISFLCVSSNEQQQNNQV